MRNWLFGLMVLGGGSLAAQATPITVEDAMAQIQVSIDQPAPATLSKAELIAYQKQTEAF